MDLTRPALTPWQRDNFERAMHAAATTLEVLFWGWLLQLPGGQRLYWEELEITCLDGDGNEPDDFPGEANTPGW